MAENKLSWTELRHALSVRAGVSEKEANLFLNALNTQLIEGLKQDKQVKINGLGMFRLQAVAPRKSVDVTTGREIIIEGYNKIAFVPEAGVKELVEKAGVLGTTAQALSLNDDPIQKLGAQADEIVGILGELGQSPDAASAEPEPAVEEPEPVVEEQEPVVEEPQPVVEEPEPVVEEPQPVVEEPQPVVEEPQPVVEEPQPFVIPNVQVNVHVTEEPKEPQPEKPKKRYHFVRDTLICVIILLLLLLIGYFFFRNQIGGWIEQWMQPQPQTEQVEPAVPTDSINAESEEPETTEEPAADTEALTDEQILEEFMQISADGDENWRDNPANSYPQLITVENMHEGSRLAWMAKRFYGAKIYWPYLYDANKDRISDPNNIDTGTPIRVPKLTKAQLDTTNQATLSTLERLRREAESAMR
jgi:nucleoid DNA-binding protein/nucleoid-associated protein YgaU